MFVKLLLAVLLPPLGVLLQKGLKGPFWVNLILTHHRASSTVATGIATLNSLPLLAPLLQRMVPS